MKKKIFIIDDEKEIVDMVKLMLESKGFETNSAYGGGQALELLSSMEQNELPDLILLDIMMVPMDGWQTLEKLKSNEKLKKIPVSMLTLVPLTPGIIKKKDMEKIENYITKPFTINKLISKVNDILDERNELEKKFALIKKKFGIQLAREYKDFNDYILRHSRFLEVLEDFALKEKSKDSKSLKYVLNNERKIISIWKAKIEAIEKRLD